MGYPKTNSLLRDCFHTVIRHSFNRLSNHLRQKPSNSPQIDAIKKLMAAVFPGIINRPGTLNNKVMMNAENQKEILNSQHLSK